MVDSTARTVYGDYNAAKFNSGEGSFIGFTGLQVNGDEISIMDGASPLHRTTQTLDLVGARAWRAIIAIQSLAPGCDRVITQSRSEDDAAIKKSYRSRGLPLLRCMGKGKWSDQEASPGITGPSWATDLIHDASWFIQSRSDALALADSIASQVSSPLPMLEGIPIRPDPRLQLGDKVRLDDPDITGLAITGVVCGVSQSVEAGEHTMTISLIVTQVETPSVTLDEFEAFHAGKTLAQLEAEWAGRTLAELDNNPLGP